MYNMCIYIYVYTSYIYIYIERERERERQSYMYIASRRLAPRRPSAASGSSPSPWENGVLRCLLFFVFSFFFSLFFSFVFGFLVLFLSKGYIAKRYLRTFERACIVFKRNSPESPRSPASRRVRTNVFFFAEVPQYTLIMT